ncbi:MAG: cytochrome c [Puia sp.]|nr:cytochrome c [Puia sp.]
MRNLYLPLLITVSLSGFLSSCGRIDRSASGTASGTPGALKTSLPGTDSLPLFSVDLDITKDTVIHTPGGAILHVPAGAIETGGGPRARLVIKEAFRMGEIVRAGLFTSSDGKPLSSGGMIDIEAAAGQTLRITQSIGVSIPTPFIDTNMQLYKGAVDDKGRINWTDPQPLPANPQATVLSRGGGLFQHHCASCHGIDKPVTGPALAYISRLRDKKWLYAFTRNNESLIYPGEAGYGADMNAGYARCLFEQYNKTPMTSFPLLTDADLDALYSYIDQESVRRGLPVPDDHFKKCYDSCSSYRRALVRMDSLRERRQALIARNGTGIKLKRHLPPGSNSLDTGRLSKIGIPEYRSVYYQFKIESFGWYNIDILLRNTDRVKKSELIVRMQGTYHREINVFLVIPSVRVFQRGGPIPGKKDCFGFYMEDGKIPLPQGATCWILATGEQDEQLVFSMESFSAIESQSIDLSPAPINKSQFNARIRTLDWQEITLQAMDSDNADSIRQTDRQMRDIEALKPKNCDCNCGMKLDTTWSPK